jgi:imidazolonepropionase-like amidohydrolase
LVVGAVGQELKVYFQQVPVGEETYTLAGGELRAHFQYSERGTTIETRGTLRFKGDWTPTYYDVHGKVYRPFSVNATVTPTDQKGAFFTVASYPPLSVQMIMLRYWLRHGRPARMRHLPAGDDIEIRETGTDVVAGVRLRRYAVGGVVWGEEALWLDPHDNLAAAVTYAGNLPLEAVRPEYQADLKTLIGSAIEDRMAWLREGAVAPLAAGRYAIVHAQLIDGSGGAAIADSAVLVEGARIVAAGAYGAVAIPPHTRVIEARGETLLPGLWEMHAHMAQVEYGPAYLAAGVTSARDCGGEFEFLVALHRLLLRQPGLGPNLLMAGLLDGSGPNTFTTNWADTPEQGRAMVDKYHAAGFVQIKVYDYIKPDVLTAITGEAHRLGMTVTGHIPRGMTAFEGVEHGMDQINHLGYVAQEVRAVGLQPTVDFLVQHHTVVDPTLAWGELLSHRPETPIASFEPGFARAPYALQSMIGSASGRGENLTRSFQIVKALYDAGVPLVAGTDKSVPAVSLHRELELYVQAGLTPMQVIDLATSGSARVMGEEKVVGTIAPGMRADMILVAGDPLRDFSALRQVRRVVTFGRLYDTAPLWRRAGFQEQRLGFRG